MESRRRSIAKGLTWRFLATVDTILLAFIFTSSFVSAASIGFIELITKIIWYYAHERVWLRVPDAFERYPRLGKWLNRTAQTRSLIKAISWRMFGALDTFLIALIVTGHVGISGSIGAAELVTKIVLYYLHDRAWSHVHWGIFSAVTFRSQTELSHRLHDLYALLHGYYRLSAAIIYGVACIFFILFSAGIIYSLHQLSLHTQAGDVSRYISIE
jgi:uncharacterized membrane protein